MNEGARHVVDESLGVASGETVVVVFDSERAAVAEALERAVDRVTESTCVEIDRLDSHGSELPADLVSTLADADVVLAATTESITHTEACREALQSDTRIASMPGITPEMLRTGVLADHDDVERLGRNLADSLDGADEIRLGSDSGTDLSIDPGDRPWILETGRCTGSRCLTNVPGGELAVAPTSAEGTLRVDGSIAGVGELDDPVTVEIEDGRAVDTDCAPLRDRFEDVGACARNVAEFGIGLNDHATLTGDPLQDEKVRGTVHVAFGDDVSLRGSVSCPIHVDAVVTAPVVWADGESVALE